MKPAAPMELHRFLLRLDPPERFRAWAYAHLEDLESVLSPSDFLELLELDFTAPYAVMQLIARLKSHVVPLPPLAEPHADDLADYLVLGDQLQIDGDPRGELIMLQASLLENGVQVLTEAELIARHEPELLGPLARYRAREVLEVDWFMGFIVRATIRGASGDEAGEIARALLRHPSGRRLRALRVDRSDDWGAAGSDFMEVVTALGEHPAQLTTLILETNDEDLWTRLGDLSGVFEAQPSLRTLELNGVRAILGPLPPDLIAFVLRTRDLARSSLERLASRPAPRLELLELWSGDETDCSADDLGRLLTRAQLPALRHLSLPCVAFLDAVVETLLASDLLPQLATLDLSRGEMTTVGARLLVANAPRLAHLERIDLRYNDLAPYLTGELSRALPRAQVAEQIPSASIRRYDLRGQSWD